MIRGVVAASNTATPLWWDPSLLSSGVQSWLDDGSPIDVNNGQLITWYDRSGNGLNWSQPLASVRPSPVEGGLNGRRYVSFSDESPGQWLFSSDQAARTLYSNAGCGWLLSVVRKRELDISATSRFLFRINVAHATRGYTRFSAEIGSADVPDGANRYVLGVRRLDGDGFSALAGSRVSDTEFHVVLYLMDWTSGTGKIYIDGRLDAVQILTTPGFTSNTPSYSSPAIGRHANSDSGFANIDTSCMLFGVASDALGEAEIDRLFGWAHHRYGLTGNMQPSHPYKTTRPLAA